MPAIAASFPENYQGAQVVRASNLIHSLSMYADRRSELNDYLNKGLLLSLALHLLFLYNLKDAPKIPVPKPAIMIDSIIAPEMLKQIEKQIVSPSDIKTSPPPENTRNVSDHDSAVEREQIRRGDHPEAGPAVGPKQSASAPQPAQQAKPAQVAASQPKPVAEKPLKQKTMAEPQDFKEFEKEAPANSPPKKLNLKTDYALMQDLSKAPAKKNQTTSSSASDPQPFSRSTGSGAMVKGYNGTIDFLPGVQDGDITMLNAKADKFAVFVRRVALRVFTLLKQYSWEFMRAEDFQDLRSDSYIVAVLDAKGKFINAELRSSSGNQQFDNLLNRSVAGGTSDPNPPPAAKAADGTYRFIFLARSWSQSAPQAGGRGYGERRWLLLKTGLE